MNRYITKYWKKLPVMWRQHIQVGVLTVLVYAMLLVLFRPAMPPPRMVRTEAGTLQPLIINASENADLALWMKQHDPAALITPGRRGGYSRLLGKEPTHQIPEDLPSPPPLSLPQMPEMVILKPQHTPSSIMPQPEAWKASAAKQFPAMPIPAAAWKNNIRMPELEQMTAAICADSQMSFRQDINAQTIIRIEPARFAGELPNMVIVQSSNIKELDLLATSTVYYYLQKNPDALQSYDTITLLWNILQAKGTQSK